MSESPEIRIARIEERIAGMEQALELQTAELARRLDTLNHAHEKAVEVQHTYVTAEKYEDKLESESLARSAALLRVDERFDEHVKKYEQRQREVEQQLTAAETATGIAQRFAEQAAQRASRNIALVGLALAALVVVINLLGVG